MKASRPLKDEKKRIVLTFCANPDLLYQVKELVAKKKLVAKTYSVSDFINNAIEEAIKKCRVSGY